MKYNFWKKMLNNIIYDKEIRRIYNFPRPSQENPQVNNYYMNEYYIFVIKKFS